MKFSESWLREWVNPEISSEELAAQITMAGLEVDEVLPVAADFSGVVVGEIISAEAHPNADKLQVCTVSDGSEEFQVVCGAPNARAGIKTPFAKVGAVLAPDFKIKKAKLRQVDSFGMLCSASELGLSDDNSGILELAQNAPVGKDLRDYLQLDDLIIDVDLTPNRSDCLSIRGLAREVGVLNKKDVQAVSVEPVSVSIDDTFPVIVTAEAACPRYLGRIIKNVNVKAASPLWLTEKLRRSGIRSIDPVVDVTNYVLLELGQPMHAFDLEKLRGSINVRMAQSNEKITLLNDEEITLRDDTLVIADDDSALALAGIMGGSMSGVSATSQHIFLESAFFAPTLLAGKARSYGLHTDGSHRFERGVDSELQKEAIERATQLIIEIAGGNAGPIIEKVADTALPQARRVRLRRQKLDQYLVVHLDTEQVTEILMRLGLKVIEVTELEWTVESPSHRFDIEIEEDLIEEVARIYGYNNIPSNMPAAAINFTASPEAKTPIQAIRSTLVAQGYQEAITYSFIDSVISKQFFPDIEPIALSNPISAEMGVMRPSLLPGLVKAYLHNQNRQQLDVRLFETGRRFIGRIDELQQLDQQECIAGLLAGNREIESWSNAGEKVDFYDVKSHVETLLSLNNSVSADYTRASVDYLHPGRSATVSISGKEVGVLGELHPQLAKKLGCNQTVYLFDLDLQAVIAGELPVYSPVSKYPEVRRDFAFLADSDLPVATLKEIIEQTAGESFKKVVVFDVYEGAGIDFNKKSVALGLTWQHHSHTLSDEEINNSVEQVLVALKDQLGVVVRG
ncbi:phenylalanine--tRNA ligase subunit beta [Marinomonas agarivorans]|nr:phenylalanine--tRNA ligase subunit beta [Marinomonas agarivorans]